MRFENRTNYHIISIAVKKADELLSLDSEMARDIRNKNNWKYGAPQDGSIVLSKLLKEATSPIPVFTYKPKKPTLATGHVDSIGIHLNINLINTITISELVGFTLHEWAHECGFNHWSPFWTTNFRTKDKDQFSVNYWLTANVERWL